MIIATFIALAVATPLFSEVVSYVDDQGKRHFVSSAELVPEAYRAGVKALDAKVRINRMDFAQSEKNTYAAGGSQTVEIFVTSWCGYCRKLEQHLKSNNISFKRFDVEHDSYGIAQYQKLGGGGVPIVRIGSKIIRGFDPAAIEAALGR